MNGDNFIKNKYGYDSIGEDTNYFEIEFKYAADDISRMAFKDLANSLNPTKFIYVESKDVYYAKSENDFIRYRMPSVNKQSGEEGRQELTLKKKTVNQNNWDRMEVNLRVDGNDSFLVNMFCKGLGYSKNFEIVKSCDIYEYADNVDLVYYSVKDENGKYSHFIEVEAMESCGTSREQAMELVQKYEKMLLPLGITPQKRKKLSLWEIFRKGF